MQRKLLTHIYKKTHLLEFFHLEKHQKLNKILQH